jgi:hypothetical protein
VDDFNFFILKYERTKKEVVRDDEEGEIAYKKESINARRRKQNYKIKESFFIINIFYISSNYYYFFGSLSRLTR